MKFGLDQVVTVGALTIAAIAKRSVNGNGDRAVVCHGEKCPVAILIRHENVTTAFEIDGSRIALDDLEQRFPGQRAEFERLPGSDGQARRGDLSGGDE